MPAQSIGLQVNYRKGTGRQSTDAPHCSGVPRETSGISRHCRTHLINGQPWRHVNSDLHKPGFLALSGRNMYFDTFRGITPGCHPMPPWRVIVAALFHRSPVTPPVTPSMLRYPPASRRKIRRRQPARARSPTMPGQRLERARRWRRLPEFRDARADACRRAAFL